MRKFLIVANVSKEHIRKFYIPLIRLLQESGWSVDVACRLDVPVPECDNAYDLPCDRNPFRGGISESVKILKDILSQNEYEILLCSTVVGSIIARLAAATFRKRGLKVIYLCHGLHFFGGAPLSRWIMGYPVEKLLANKTDMMIVINETDLETARKYLNIPVIVKSHGMGVDLSKFRDGALSESDWIERRKELGLSVKDFVLSYVAEIINNKNQMMLVNAFEHIRKEVPNARLLLIGPEHDGGVLRKFVESRGLQNEILFLGWRNDVSDLLHLSDIYVASSKSEGQGLNLIEAMACNLPVIATKNRGHVETVHHERNGFLVESGDYGKMAEYVLRIYNDAERRDSITVQAQQDIEKYETDVAVKELADMILCHAQQ